MSTKHHVPHSVVSGAFRVADDMEPLKSKKNPVVAATLGFFTCGIGLGIYLGSWLDFAIPFCMLLALAVMSGGMLVEFAPFFWALYGYRRAKTSNAKLEAQDQIVEAQIITQPPPIRSIQECPTSLNQLHTRLRKLDDLLREGILTPSEHAEKRSKLLQEI